MSTSQLPTRTNPQFGSGTFSGSPSPLSYQTVMPEYPDVTYERYQNTYGLWDGRGSNSVNAWINGYPNYETWRTNLLDEYNARMSAYNTWLGTGAGQRASLESGNYNPSYFSGQNAAASGIDPGQVSEGAGFSEMAQGIKGIFDFAMAIMSIRSAIISNASKAAQTKLIEQQTEAQRINNQYLEGILQGKTAGLNFQNDKRQFELESLFYPRWSKYPELWKGGVFSPYGRGSYDLRDADLSFGYQRQVKDLGLMDAAKNLRDSQNALLKASKREKDWYYENVFSIQKEILEHTRDILKGEYEFQPMEQKLRKAGIIANISVGVINAAVNAVRTFIPALNSGVSSLSSILDSPASSPNLGPASGGLDLSGFGSYSPFE